MKPDKTIHEVTFEYNFSHIVKPQAVNEIEAGQLISIFQFKWLIAEPLGNRTSVSSRNIKKIDLSVYNIGKACNPKHLYIQQNE